ncbi:MAG: Na(+)/H(+) antiporter subunit C [Actinomycetaceae bacterium]|nr:Na(+)/H(+) antiporter subunit C [Actinomycetaceae bacterium]
MNAPTALVLSILPLAPVGTVARASLAIIVLGGGLIAAGAYLVMERTLTRIVIGLSLVAHGVNLLILAAGGGSGLPPLLSGPDPASMADPLPQAMMLTAIVISLGTTAFGMALAYRSWRLAGHDEVIDDVEDRRLARRSQTARRDESMAEQTTGGEDPGIDYDAEDVDEDVPTTGEETQRPRPQYRDDTANTTSARTGGKKTNKRNPKPAASTSQTPTSGEASGAGRGEEQP